MGNEAKKQCEAGRPYAGSDFQVGEPCPNPGEFQVIVSGSRLGGAVCRAHAEISARGYAKTIPVAIVRVTK